MKTVKEWLETIPSGVSIDAITDTREGKNRGMTALHYAVKKCSASMVELLLERHAGEYFYMDCTQ